MIPPAGDAPASSSVPKDVVFNTRGASRPEDEFSFDHPRVNDFVENYQTRWHGFFESTLERSGKYLPRMAAIMEKEGLPPELAYLPFVESGFRNQAVSPAGAVGPWQFVSATGRRYGLRIDSYVDERRDPVKSTRAAAHYLRDLYGMFGSWHLSLAAYNTGEERVARVMDRQGADTFWEMAENGYLYPETCNYVPQFLAVLQIARAPEAHGFEDPVGTPLRYDLVRVNGSVSLRMVAKMVGSSVEEIAELNPALLRGVTPPDHSGYRMRVPKGTKDQFEVAYAKMLHEARDAQALPAVAARHGAKKDNVYTVRKGETPQKIAKRLGVSVGQLVKTNGWKNAKGVKTGAKVRAPGAATKSAKATAKPTSAPTRVASKRAGHSSRVN